MCNLRTLEGQEIEVSQPQLSLLTSLCVTDEAIGGFLDEAGSFSSPQHSLEFVRTVALVRIESMIRTPRRLESAFTTDATYNNVTFQFGAPDIVFDEVTSADPIVPLDLRGGMRLRIRRKWGLEKSMGRTRRKSACRDLEKDVVGGWN